jgi:hypothetical protein
MFVVLLVLGALGFGGMLALTIFVDPGEKDITIKIPPRELVPPSQPIDINNLPAPVNVAPKDESSSASAASSEEPDDKSSDVKTLAPGDGE